MNWKAVRDSWFNFWFSAQSPLPLALYRVVFGLLVLQTLFHFSSNFDFVFGSEAFIPADAISAYGLPTGPRINLFMLVPGSNGWYHFYFSTIVLAALFLTFGFLTRFSAFWVWLGISSCLTHCPFTCNASDRFECLVSFLFALSNAGEVISIDSLVKHRKDDWRKVGFETPLQSGWPLRLFQVQICIAYLHTAFSKLSGRQWLDGSVIYLCTRLRDFHRFSLPVLFDTAFGCKLVAWSTLLIETSLGSLVWIKELRYWILLSGLLMHLTIDYVMNIPVFEGLFMASYLLFVYPEDLRKVMSSVNRWIAHKLGPPAVLAFDGNCLFCVRIAGILHRLDLFERLSLADVQDLNIHERPQNMSDKQLLVKTEDRWTSGFKAFCWLTKRLPLLWPLIPFLYLPGSTVVGERIYTALSSRKTALFDETCIAYSCSS